MARKGGPKSRKRRYTGTAALRALRSVPKAQRSEIKGAVRKATGTTGKLSRKQKVGVGKSIRKQRIARGRNPNTGTGSLATFAVRRAKKKGMISKVQARKAIATIRSRPSERAAAAGEVSKLVGRSASGKRGVASIGARAAVHFGPARKVPAATPKKAAPKKAAPKKGGGGGVFRQAYKKTLPGIGKKALAKKVSTARAVRRSSRKTTTPTGTKPVKKPTRTSRAR